MRARRVATGNGLLAVWHVTLSETLCERTGGGCAHRRWSPAAATHTNPRGPKIAPVAVQHGRQHHWGVFRHNIRRPREGCPGQEVGFHCSPSALIFLRFAQNKTILGSLTWEVAFIKLSWCVVLEQKADAISDPQCYSIFLASFNSKQVTQIVNLSVSFFVLQNAKLYSAKKLPRAAALNIRKFFNKL